MSDQPSPGRRFQFSLLALLTVVTVVAMLAGGVRWLIILTGGEVAAAVILSLSLVALWARISTWSYRLHRRWARWREARGQRSDGRATSKLLELPEVQEAILAARKDKSQESVNS
jgi:hypothetical protein